MTFMCPTMGEGVLSNFDIFKIAQSLKIPNFRGIFMRDQLPQRPKEKECAIVNLNSSDQPGSHWVCYYKNGKKRIYFDSFAQITPFEIQKYLKTKEELKNDVPIIERNTDIVQKPNTNICGHLCLYVLDKLSKGVQYQDVIESLL